MAVPARKGGLTGGAMRQRILGSHTPPCHRRMVITTQFSVFTGGGGYLCLWDSGEVSRSD